MKEIKPRTSPGTQTILGNTKLKLRTTFLLAENTLDQWLYDIIQEKKAIANEITGAEDNVPVSILNRVMDLFK